MTKKKMKNIIPLPFDGTPCKNSKWSLELYAEFVAVGMDFLRQCIIIRSPKGKSMNSKPKWILLRMFGVGWRKKRDYEQQ